MAPSSLPSLEYIRLIARIDAIENVLAGLYQKVNILLGVSPSQFEKQVEELRRELRGLVPPGLTDPAVSDLVAGEIQQAHEALLQKLLAGDERPK
jgi:uncharacterized circularly permuted ATP-grasp superfamily protein